MLKPASKFFDQLLAFFKKNQRIDAREEGGKQGEFSNTTTASKQQDTVSKTFGC